MNQANETLYSVYKNAGFCWPIALCAISLGFVAILGLFLNVAVIWVTIKTKSLHGTANFLLALCSFYELLHQHGHLLFLWMALSGQNFLPYATAVRVCTVPLFALGGVAPSMAFTGPNRISKKLYLRIVVLICMASCTFILTAFYVLNGDLTTMITGMLGEITSMGTAGSIYSNYTFFLYNVTIIIYVVVGLVLKYRTVPGTDDPNTTFPM